MLIPLPLPRAGAIVYDALYERVVSQLPLIDWIEQLTDWRRPPPANIACRPVAIGRPAGCFDNICRQCNLERPGWMSGGCPTLMSCQCETNPVVRFCTGNE